MDNKAMVVIAKGLSYGHLASGVDDEVIFLACPLPFRG